MKVRNGANVRKDGQEYKQSFQETKIGAMKCKDGVYAFSMFYSLNFRLLQPSFLSLFPYIRDLRFDFYFC